MCVILRTILKTNSNATMLQATCRPVWLDGQERLQGLPGEERPRLEWFYYRPQIAGDVPIPSEVVLASPPQLEMLTVTPQRDNVIRLETAAYQFPDVEAVFYCRASYEGLKVAEHTVYIHRTTDRYRVQIYDEKLRRKSYEFVGSNTQLTCLVDDRQTGERTEPMAYFWRIRYPDGVLSNIHRPGELATSISGIDSRQLSLVGLTTSPEAGFAEEEVYGLICTAQHNATYETQSNEFRIHIRKKPVLTKISFERLLPNLETLEDEKDTYSNKIDYKVACNAEISGPIPAISWQKCKDSECSSAVDILPRSNSLEFYVNATDYQDEGMFRCVVLQFLPNYNYELNKTKIFELKRQGELCQ
ncbi:unnamed protein product [Protopolystoma xenopodis]|uniref:Ig-like domain-containing protein n=1 Tax=Protopolystoma xenopodis TaxID=117903 RepID=A0A3S5CGI7_9PLAT|nr:unnamed protein product [Protopolystoma xenopodis]